MIAYQRLSALLVGLVLLTNSGCAIAYRSWHGCGCGPACGTACGPGCATSCGTGCGATCGIGAGDRWHGSACEGPRFCICTTSDGACCGGNCGCGVEPSCGCEATCAAEPGCAVEPGCAFDPGCGCEPSCGVGGGCSHCGEGLIHRVGRAIGCTARGLGRAVFGCGGCGGELYWSEWHNDAPRCCDPCDSCGNWVGPSAGSYHAPYAHELSPTMGNIVANQQPAAMPAARVARQATSTAGDTVRR